ncbi:MAG: SurA N-terminal domain-containing protein [Ehrlichia sp.]
MLRHTIVLFFLFVVLYCGNVFADVKIVAMVNDELISSLDLERRVDINKFFYKVDGSTAKEIALNSLIDESVWRQEAKRLKLTVDEQEVVEFVKQFSIMKNLGNIDFKGYVAKQGLDYALCIQHFTSKLLWNKILMLKVIPYIIVSDKEVQDSNDSTISGNGLDTSLHIQEVIIPSDVGNETVISTVVDNLQSGMSIEDIRKNIPGVVFEEASINAKSVDADLGNRLLGAKVGDVIGPIKNEYGNLVIRLLHRSDISREFSSSSVDLRQIHLVADQLRKYSSQVGLLKARATCENFSDIAKELGLPNPSIFVAKVKDLSVKMQNVLQLCDVGKIVEVTDSNVIDIIMLCNVKKGKATDVIGDVNFIRQRLYMEKLAIQSEYFLSSLKKGFLIERYN